VDLGGRGLNLAQAQVPGLSMPVTPDGGGGSGDTPPSPDAVAGTAFGGEGASVLGETPGTPGTVGGDGSPGGDGGGDGGDGGGEVAGDQAEGESGGGPPVAAAGNGGGEQQSGDLPFTGAAAALVGAIGSAATAAGLALRRLTRRRATGTTD
jgi:hypothetical protein